MYKKKNAKGKPFQSIQEDLFNGRLAVKALLEHFKATSLFLIDEKGGLNALLIPRPEDGYSVSDKFQDGQKYNILVGFEAKDVSFSRVIEDDVLRDFNLTTGPDLVIKSANEELPATLHASLECFADRNTFARVISRRTVIALMLAYALETCDPFKFFTMHDEATAEVFVSGGPNPVEYYGSIDTLYRPFEERRRIPQY